MTPNEAIAAFISGLPAPARTDLCALLLGYLSDLPLAAIVDVERNALAMINPDDPDLQFRSALCVAAILDYLFATIPPDCSEKLLEAAERVGSETMKTSAMRLPLQIRYREAAGKKWVELRRTELTHDKFADYERSLLGLHTAKSTSIP